MHTKGIAPIVSTVVLIGFAIALGGVVISWGKVSYDVELAECGEMGLASVTLEGDTLACMADGTLEMTVQNTGQGLISGFKGSLLADSGVQMVEITENLGAGEYSRLRVVLPDGMANLNKAFFTPGFRDAGELTYCPQQGFSIESIGACV